MDELRPIRKQRLHHGRVKVVPTRPARISRVRVDRDDLEICARHRCRRKRKQPVVRTHERMPPAWPRSDTQSRLAPRDTLIERSRSDHQVIELCIHKLTSPRMQETELPPTQMVSPSRSMCTRPVRSMRVP